MPSLHELERTAASTQDAGAMHAYGVALMHRRELDAAVEWLARAVTTSEDVTYRIGLGAALSLAGRSTEAEACFEMVLARAPDRLDAARHLAWLSLNQRRRPSRGVELLAAVIARAPDDVDDYAGLCHHWLMADGRANPSAEDVSSLLRGGRPDLVLRGLAMALMNTGRYAEALTVLDSAPATMASPELIVDMARAALGWQGLDSARARFERGLQDYPASAALLASYLQFLFRIDEIPAAQQIYRLSLGRQARGGARAAVSRESLPGTTLLLRAIGGYGDTIQWARFAPLLADVGCRVILECLPSLSDLLRTMPGVAAVVAPGDPPPAHDAECRADEPPLMLDWTWADLNERVPALRIGSDGRGRRKTIDPRSGYRVGLCWQSGYNRDTQHDPYACRSIAPHLLNPLRDLPGVTFHGLGLASDDSPDYLVPASGVFADFSDTAAAIDAVDVVVTVDTSVAHLAGAMGKPTLLMLPYIACWRWGKSAHTCGWYPSTRLLRQPRPGAWDAVVEAVAQDLHIRSQMAGHTA